MTQTELIDFFCQRLQLNPSIQSEIRIYLLGETETAASIPPRKGYIPYHFAETLIEHFTSDFAETAKRAYRLLGIICEYELIKESMYRSNNYKVCFEAEMPETFIAKIISEKISNSIHNNSIEIFSKTINSMSNKKDLFGLTEAFCYYEDFIDREIRLSQDNRKKESPDSFVLKALGSVWFADDPVKKQDYDTLTANAVFAALKTLYQDKDLQTEAKALFSAESAELYEHIQADDLGMKKNLNLLVFTICYLLKEESPQLKDALKLCLVMEKPKTYKEWLKESVVHLFELQMSLNLPLKMPFSLAAEGIFLEKFIETGSSNAKLLITCYKMNKDTFIDCYKSSQSDALPDAFPLLSILCRENEIPEITKEADDLFLIYLSRCQMELGFQFIPEERKEEADLYLEELVTSETIDFDYKHGPMTLTAICASLIYDYSKNARNVMSIFLKSATSLGYGRIYLDILYTGGKGFLNQFNMQEALENLALTAGAKCVCTAYTEQHPGAYHADFLLFAKAHLADAAFIFNETREKQDDTIQNKVNIFYSEDIGLSYEELSLVLEHRLKSVVNFMETFLADKEEKVRIFIEKIAKGKNKNGKEAAIRLIKLWDSDKIEAELAAISDIDALTQYIKGIYVIQNKNKVPYIEHLSPLAVHIKGKKEIADPVLMSNGTAVPLLIEYFLSEYMLLKEVQKIKTCEKIREFLDSNDLNALLQEFYLQWLRDGADTKLKNIVIPYAIGANITQIAEYKKQIDSFTENSRGALAAFMVTALSENSSDFALLLIDGISKKYKNKQVKAAAEAAIERAAEILGISKEALGDKIIPTLSFSKNREIVFDFGSRKFKGVLTDNLEVILYDEDGKKIKNLPKVSAKDDKELADQAVAACKDLKKQLKAVISSQKIRLEDAVITGRRWTREQWEYVFVDNPIMNCFATGLIWEEITRTGELIGTFRYMSDGSFNSPDEEEYELTKDSHIILLHPLDVSEELLKTWITQLEDYEIIQPITQLSMPIFEFNTDELEGKVIKRHEGGKVYFGTIRGIMDKYDWRKTSITDGGGYSGYYYEDAASDIGIQITFDFLYVGMESNDTAKIQTIEFYKRKTIRYASYTYDDVNDNNRVPPRLVPKKLACFALMVLDVIAQKAIS